MVTAEDLKKKGNAAFGNQEFKKAAKIYRDAINLDPSNPVLYSNRAICFIKLKSWERAIEDCTVGLSLDCDLKTKVKLIWRKSIAMIEIGDFENALDLLNDGLSIDPENQVLIQEKSDVLEKLRSKKRKRQDSTMGLEDIQIEIVEELPSDFQRQIGVSILASSKNTAKQESSMDLDDNDELESELMNIEGVVLPTKKVARPEPELKTFSNDIHKFPSAPSIYYLSTLSRLADKSGVYGYVVSLKPSHLSLLFQSSGIDTEVLSLYIDSALYYASNNPNGEYLNYIVECLSNFPTFPRFSIASMFVSASKLSQLFDILYKFKPFDLRSLWK